MGTPFQGFRPYSGAFTVLEPVVRLRHQEKGTRLLPPSAVRKERGNQKRARELVTCFLQAGRTS